MAARMIKWVKRRDHITPHLAKLHCWLPVRLRIKFKFLVLVYKCINGFAPSYLKKLITIRRHFVNLRFSRSVLLHVAVTKKKGCGDRTFSRIDPLLWNELPPAIQTSDSLLSFRSRLKSHFFRLEYPEFCTRTQVQRLWSSCMYFVSYFVKSALQF
jgi:hypothetical protein